MWSKTEVRVYFDNIYDMLLMKFSRPKQMLRWFPTFQVATTCFSCNPPELNLLVTNFIFCIHVKQPLPPGDNPIAVNKYYYYHYYYHHHHHHVYLLYCVCIAVSTLDAGLLARSQYSEGPATGHLDTAFSWFPCLYKQMLRWLPRFQVATTCFSCSPPDLNLLVTSLMFCIHVK